MRSTDDTARRLEFVFSLRSPYSWIATEHVLPQVNPEIDITWTPFLPLPGFPNFGRAMAPAKVTHNLQDILRLADAYGLEVGRPPVDEDDWITPHAAFAWAEERGAGPTLARALVRARWARGERVGDAATLRAAATEVGLPPDALLEASRNESIRRALVDRVQSNYDDRGLFGVPMFVLPDGTRFWGHDRMEWALRHGYVEAAPR